VSLVRFPDKPDCYKAMVVFVWNTKRKEVLPLFFFFISN
jgi:hypothetical protein